ncbi:5'-methylthioadenosine phosphorylase [Chromatiales bacterium (ex Bugula neritina AB1)]|nr:5'-methylthioadenosine phosphorylase [Chromatiales bacterium (ex Bugula neritina AB1)]
MAKIAIIGGTGLTSMPGLTVSYREMVKTIYGAPSCPLVHGELNGNPVIFLARHGRRHTIPPHMVNYRANLMALRDVGVTHIIALAAVGGIADNCLDKTIVVPDQIIDYTYGRAHTFHGDKHDKFDHIDFTAPYSASVRNCLLNAGKLAGVPHLTEGVYGATQGPRLETAAEIRRMERDGCTIVGMTGMPEASLARELGLEYGCCAMVVNRAPGKGAIGIDFHDIEQNVRESVNSVQRILAEAMKTDFDLESAQ